MRSMTGFGQASGSNPRHAVAIALRGVNHRFLDLALRLREEYRSSEAELRELLSAVLYRGRVEAAVEVTPLAARRAEVTVDRDVVEALHAASRELAERGLVVPQLTLGDLARLPEVVRVEVAADAWEADDHRLLLEVAAEALRQFVEARRREGEKLGQVLGVRLGELEAIVARLESRRGIVARELGEALRRRLLELTAGQEIDPGRLAQEAALLVDRSDIREELDRLGTHIEHFRTVAGESGAVGKRLDFLAQEIFRELNTLGAKSRDAEMIRWTLDAKVVCEQLREQVQNVE
jgi:uncharacterized protein (TIGR00255 family)